MRWVLAWECWLSMDRQVSGVAHSKVGNLVCSSEAMVEDPNV